MFNTMMSISSLIIVYKALCRHELLHFVEEKNQHFYDILCLNRVILIRTVSNLFTMLRTKMSFPSSNIVYIEKLPFVHVILPIICAVYSLTQVISNGLKEI